LDLLQRTWKELTAWTLRCKTKQSKNSIS
jgi:hypothetical protein